MVILNEVSQPISIEYKMVHGLHQAAFRALYLEMFPAFDLSGFQLCFIVRTLKEDKPLRLLMNLLFYHFSRSEPTYKSQSIKLLDVPAACNQLNVNTLN